MHRCISSIIHKKLLSKNIAKSGVSFLKCLYPTLNTYPTMIKRWQSVAHRWQPAKKDQTQFKVAIEGNIGCGKSTLLSYLSDNPSVEVHLEPISQWTDIEGHNALERFYKRPTRWAFSFTSLVLLSRARVHCAPQLNAVSLMERSLYSTRYCFIQNDTELGTLSSMESALLDKQFQYLCETSNLSIDLIVYLRASPEQCYQRLLSRGRNEESTVPLSYLERLHKLHDDWLLLQNQFSVPCPVLVLDANQDLETMKNVYDAQRSEILCGCC